MLASWQQSISKAYATRTHHKIYSALERTRKEIRVATLIPSGEHGANSLIRCELETVSLDNESDLQFEALSYCWGVANITKKILLCGRQMRVTTNLYAALVEFRKLLTDKPLRIWIDAICINQVDLAERGYQVTLMRQIYHRASNVRIWLGPEQPETAGDFEALRTILAGTNTITTCTEWSQVEALMHEFQSVHRLMGNSYWFRTWTMQERAASESLSLHCGRCAMDVSAPRQFCYTILLFLVYNNPVLVADSFSQLESDIYKTYHNAAHPRNLKHFAFYSIATTIMSGKAAIATSPLSECALYLRSFEASKEQDRIYGMLGLFSDVEITPDYHRSAKDTFEAFTRQLIQRELSYVALYWTICMQIEPDLPSWVFDPRLPTSMTRINPETGISSQLAVDAWFTLSLEVTDPFDASAGTDFSLSSCQTVNTPGLLGVQALFVDQITSTCVGDLGRTYFSALDQVESFPDAWIEDDACVVACCANTLVVDDIAALNLADASREVLRTCTARDIELLREVLKILHDGIGVNEPPINRQSDRLGLILSAAWVFRTAKGAFGITQGHFQPGDQIWIFPSSRRPFVLRQVATNGRATYRLVGTCYLHGIMSGEAVHEAASRKDCDINQVFDDIWLV